MIENPPMLSVTVKSSGTVTSCGVVAVAVIVVVLIIGYEPDVFSFAPSNW